MREAEPGLAGIGRLGKPSKIRPGLLGLGWRGLQSCWLAHHCPLQALGICGVNGSKLTSVIF